MNDPVQRPDQKLIKVDLHRTQPLRVLESSQGPVFKLDLQRIAAERQAAAARPAPAGLKRRAAASLDEAVPAVRKPSPKRPIPPPSAKKVVPPAFGPKRDRLKSLSQRYKVVSILGEGGTGVVYKAEDLFLDMPVAIKLLNPKLTHDKSAIATLKAEARIAMRLSHQHIVHLHNLEKSGSSFFLVMEHIEGSTFRELLSVYHYLQLDTVIQTLRVCSDALSYAHRHGVLHNDLKPENLLITKEGILKIIDFGISCLINTRQEDFIMGTPAYMSPEQIRGEELDRRTDVYSLGIMTYEFLTGKTPFPDNVSLHDVLKLLPVDVPNVHPDLRPVILRALAPNEKDRWESVETYVTAFINTARPLVPKSSEPEPVPPTNVPTQIVQHPGRQ